VYLVRVAMCGVGGVRIGQQRPNDHHHRQAVPSEGSGKTLALERHGIAHVPTSRRYGRPRSCTRWAQLPAVREFLYPDCGIRPPNIAGLAAMIVGVLISVPFVANDFYTGPIGSSLDGADLSYFVSGIVAALLYPVLRARFAPRRTYCRPPVDLPIAMKRPN
jgi:hypothetical protein